MTYDWTKDERWRGISSRYLWSDEQSGLSLSVWEPREDRGHDGFVALESDGMMRDGTKKLDDAARRRLIDALQAVPAVQQRIIQELEEWKQEEEEEQ